MNDRKDNSNRQLEGMLRKWGAQVSTEESEKLVGSPLLRKGNVVIPLRWLGAAVAASLIIGVGLGLVVMSASLRRDGPSASAEHQAMIDRNTEAEEKLANLEIRLAQQYRLSQQQIASSLASQAKSHKAELTALQEYLKDTRSEQVATSKALRQVSDEAKRLRESVNASKLAREKLEEKLSTVDKSFKTQIAQLQEKQSATDAQAKSLRDQLATIKARHKSEMDSHLALLQKISASNTFHDYRDAMRQGKVLKRLGKIRPTVGSDSAALLDRVEVLLTRFDMLKLNDPKAVDGFARLVGRSRIGAKIDKALETPSEQTDLRLLLLEARLILKGVSRAA